MAFSIAGSSEGSQGWSVISVGSGTARLPTWLSGVGRAVVVDADHVEHRERGPAGAHGPQLAEQGVHVLRMRPFASAIICLRGIATP